MACENFIHCSPVKMSGSGSLGRLGTIPSKDDADPSTV